jgi:hypothetical protein
MAESPPSIHSASPLSLALALTHTLQLWCTYCYSIRDISAAAAAAVTAAAAAVVTADPSLGPADVAGGHR